MVTGDRADAAETIGAALDLDAVLADREPSDKVDAVASEQRQHPTVMVGDGINDAPALAAADVGVAMGARGASASSEAADVVILVDRLDRVGGHRHCKTRPNASLFKASLPASACRLWRWSRGNGIVAPDAGGASTQEVIDVAVILNALRALRPGLTPAKAAQKACRSPGSRELRRGHVELLEKSGALANDRGCSGRGEGQSKPRR